MKFLIFLLILSCSHEHHQHGTNEANRHMHGKSQTDLIKAFNDPARDSYQRPQDVLKFMGNLKGKKVIDIGSGGGYFTRYLLEAGAEVTAADVDETFLAHLRKTFSQEKYPNITLLKIEFDDPKMGTGSYDVAFMANTYHHLNDRKSYLQKIQKGLRKKGQFVVVDFKKGAQIGPPAHLRISADEVIQELRNAGFQRVEVSETDFKHHYCLKAML